MKQYQFDYRDFNQFSEELEKVESLINGKDETKVLFKVLSDILLTDSVDIVISELANRFPKAKIVGCTTNGNILYGHKSDSNVIVMCTVFECESTVIDVVSCNINGRSADDIKQFLIDAYKERPYVKAVEALVTMQSLSMENFHEAFDISLDGLIIFGGGAYNKDMINDKSYVFTKDMNYTKDSFVLVLYGGEELFIDTISIAGWKPLGQQYEITKAKDNIVYEIDGRPAFEIYSKYLNVKNNVFFNANSIEFPFLCSNDDGYEILRTPVSADSDNSIQMFSRIDDFKYMRLTYGDPDTILHSVKMGAQEIKKFKPDAISIFSCIARKSFWGKDIDKESSLYQKIAPTFGFFTSGELLSQSDRIHHHNETMVIVAFREGILEDEAEHPEEENLDNEGEMPLISRLVNFIGVATGELEDARAEAVMANKAKSDFLANMSHEIRTPINAILGFDTMIMRSAEDEKVLEYARDIASAGDSLLNIINDILDLSKIESGNMEIIPAEYDTAKLIGDIVNMVSLKIQDKGLKFELDVDSTIPSKLYGDDIRIKQVIVNLLNNAVKYTEKGSVTLQMTNVYSDDEIVLRVRIKDTGIGIKEEDVENLFKKFKRIEESRNRSIEGTGLGISIVVQFLKLMGSELYVSSEYGKGSEFGFDICQRIVDQAPIGDVTTKLHEKKSRVEYKKTFEAPDADILLVDDNPLNRKVIVNLLGETKIKIDEADGGFGCIEKSVEKKYDLILLDHMMPDLDGVVTAHRIKDDADNPNRYTPIIMLTANALAGAREEYMKEGLDDFLTKPVKPEILEKLIVKYLPTNKVLMQQDNEQEKIPVVEKPAEPSYSFESEQPQVKPIQRPAEGESVLNRIEGIEVRYALENLMSYELAEETVQMVGESAKSDIDELNAMYECLKEVTSEDDIELTEAFKSYRIKVHAIKSQSSTIGAMEMYGMARFLEMAAKDMQYEKIAGVHRLFADAYLELGERINEAFEG